MNILEVHEAGLPPAFPGGRHGITYRFDDGPAIAADLTVAAATRAPVAGFDRHVLNRPLAQRLLHERPDAVCIRGLHGCTLDLPRVAKLLGLPVCVDWSVLPDAGALDGRSATALRAAFDSTDVVLADGPGEGYRESRGESRGEGRGGHPAGPPRVHSPAAAQALLAHCPPACGIDGDYALYEFCLRDHPLLVEMQRPYLGHFAGCRRVLDLGCGAGIFVELLAAAGVAAEGVERSPLIAGYARGMGLAVETANALAYLRGRPGGFDGIYCSHFVEHLPFDAVRELMRGLAAALDPGGVLLLVFPDPESIRSQLLGFWRDPEHVRFYHPELIEMLGASLGLRCEWRSDREQPHEVIGFPLRPPPLPPLGAEPPAPESPAGWRRWLARLGLADGAEVAALRARLARSEAALQALAAQVGTLWQVNQTWAWNDNVALRFRKPGGEGS